MMNDQNRRPLAAIDSGVDNYHYQNSEFGCAHDYLMPVVTRILDEVKAVKVFELGCGNGSVANFLCQRNIEIIGIDYSTEGIEQANKAFPEIRLEVGSAYDDLQSKFGQFPLVLSLEVVEHLFSPRIFAMNVFNLLEPGGYAVISTPFHGYWKNLALALTGKLDGHFTALWDGGHIKFWSEKTMTELMKESGFMDIRFFRAGRVSALAKSMVVVARKPKQ